MLLDASSNCSLAALLGSGGATATATGRTLGTWRIEQGTVCVTWLDGRVDRVSFGAGDTVADIKLRILDGDWDPRLQLVREGAALRDAVLVVTISNEAPWFVLGELVPARMVPLQLEVWAVMSERLCSFCAGRDRLRHCAGSGSRCPVTWYCGKSCQRAHWLAHRAVCRGRQGEPV